MLNIKNIEFNKSDLFIYLILIPFMYPRGFSEYFSIYKLFFTLWTYGAVVLIVVFAIFRMINGCNKYKKCVLAILAYFGYFAIDTLILQGGITQGIQKVFVTPALCLFCVLCLDSRQEQLIRCLSNILIIIFILNLTIFHPALMKAYFSVDGHLIFLGHVQIAAQMGLLGVFLSYLCKRFHHVWRSRTLIIMSIATMIMSDTVAGKIALVVLFICTVFLQIKKNHNIFYADARYYIALWIILNIVLLGFTFCLNGNYMLFGLDVSMSGRMFVWTAVIDLLKESLLLGYGAYGVLIRVFWHAPNTGMNYAHNEMLQRMLDGGIILLILFIIFLFMLVKDSKFISDKFLKANANVILLILGLMMLVESVTEYYYVYVLLMIMAYLPEIENAILKKEKLVYGIDVDTSK